jgi:erythromycin esterase-like protein
MRVSAALACLLTFTVEAQTMASLKPAVPLDAVSAIIEAFTTHDIVALGEGSHGNEQ